MEDIIPLFFIVVTLIPAYIALVLRIVKNGRQRGSIHHPTTSPISLSERWNRDTVKTTTLF